MPSGHGWWVLGLITALSLPLIAAPATSQATGASLELFAHWPANIAEAMEAPIVLTPLYPDGEPDLSQGPALPGVERAGTLPQFTYTLINPDGSPGPFGDVALDTQRPAVLTFFLSADETPWPTAAGEPPVDADYGVVPTVTVSAELRFGERVVAQADETHDLVSLPDPIGAQIQAYILAFDVPEDVLRAGQGLHVDIAIHQVTAEQDRVMQPGFNVHTGQDHPTGLVLPLVVDERLDEDRDGISALAFDEMDPETKRSVALGTLIAALAIAAASLVKIVWDLRRPG